MKKWIRGGLLALLLLLAAWPVTLELSQAGPAGGLRLVAAEARAEEQEQDVDFWTSFKGLFLSEEPQYEDRGPKQTQVSGVRGLDKEGKLAEAYDWQAVHKMEALMISEEQMFSFLKEGGVGPFFGKEGGGK